MLKKTTAIVLSAGLVWLGALPAFAPTNTQPALAELVKAPYLELLATALAVKFTQKEVDDFKKHLESEKRSEQRRLEQEEQQLNRPIKEARQRLKDLNRRMSRDTEAMTAQRRDLHCRIRQLERAWRQKNTERKHGLPVAYENKLAKLDLIQQWPAKKQEIARALAEGRARQRPFGNVEDIGFRKVGEGQEKDIKLGEDAVREMNAYGLMPPEVEDKELTGYVKRLAVSLAANSDLKVPLRVTVLDSEEINAFALPGGFLFVNAGLIEKAETESEFVGVLAHEIAHTAARHGVRLVKRATMAGLVFQAAEIAALIFTGGAVSAGMYYALQYGFFGLGMVLDLALLGVSREYELEADQLGVQYVWHAGYDPAGFITFFDTMAGEKGYIRSASFFRTHPPFFERIVRTFSEIEYLPLKEDLKVDSTEFQRAKERLRQVTTAREREQKNRPTIRRLPECGDDEDKPVRWPE